MTSNASISTTEDLIERPWTLEITPGRSLLDVPIREIWQYRDLLLLLVRRDFMAAFKQSLLGPAWWFIQPLLTTLMFVLVFGRIANITTDGLPHLPFYLAGVTCWTFFSNCFTNSANTLLTNAALFEKVYFPRLIVPISQLALQLLKFGVQLLQLAVVVAYYMWLGQMYPRWDGLLLAPALLVLMSALGLGMGLILAAMTAKYRDLVNLITFGIQLLMYATPVIYPASIAKGKFETILWMNPLTPIFEALRFGFLGTGHLSVGGLAYSAAFAAMTLFVGVIFFNQLEKSYTDSV